MKIFRKAQTIQEYVAIDRFYEGKETEVYRGSYDDCWNALLQRVHKEHGTSWDFAIKNNLVTVMPAEEWSSQGLANNMIGNEYENY